MFKKTIITGVQNGADRDSTQLEISEQLDAVRSDIMGSRFGSDLQLWLAPQKSISQNR
jgi:hypothetical protein